MVNFTHFETGTAEAHWQASVRLREAPALALPPAVRLTVLAAHPDDETLAAGGLIAAVAAAGGAVDVVVATDGENSHPDSRTWTPARLAAERRIELERAMAQLGTDITVHWLGHPDGGLAQFEAEAEAQIKALLEAKLGVLAERTSTPHWLATPWRGDGHPDHEAIGRVGAALAAENDSTLLELPIWFWHWGTDADLSLPWSRLHRFDLDPSVQLAKTRAMAEHRTQVLALSPEPGDEAILPPAMTAHFERPYEVFVLTHPSR